MKIAVICYDLQQPTEAFLNRLQLALPSSHLVACPLYYHKHQEFSRVPFIQSRLKSLPVSLSESGTVHEAIAVNVNWRALIESIGRSDIILLFGLQGPTALLATVFGKLVGRKVISVNQTLPLALEARRRWWVRYLKGFLVRACDVCVYQTPVSRQALKAVYGVKENSMIFAPFEGGAELFELKLSRSEGLEDFRKREGIPRDNVLFAYVGNVIPLKNVELLIRAAARLSERTNWNLLIVGPEEPRYGEKGTFEFYRSLAKNLGIGDRVQLTGRLDYDALVDLYGAIDALILPSSRDTFGKVFIEAGLAGAALIASDACGAVGAVVQDGINGRVFESGNLSQLSAIMEQCLDRQVVLEMGRSSPQIIRDFCSPAAELNGFVSAIERVSV